MEPKKIKKLVLNKETISSLTESSKRFVIAGKETEGTGYGLCVCNPTDYCYNSKQPGLCGTVAACLSVHFSCNGGYCA